MSKHLITRILAGVATLTIAGSMALASPASAEPNGSGTPAKKSCVNPETGKTDQPHGTVWTSTTQNGQIASQYKCNDGNWDKVENPKASVRPSRLSRAAGATTARATF